MFCHSFFSFFAPLGPLGLIIMVQHSPKKCSKGTMLLSAKNTGLVSLDFLINVRWKYFLCPSEETSCAPPYTTVSVFETSFSIC